MKRYDSSISFIILALFVIGCESESTPNTPEIGVTPIPPVAGDSSVAVDPSDPAIACSRTFMFRGNVSTSSVKVAGTFEDPPWRGTVALNDDDGDMIWTADILIAEGDYDYKFVVDGQWICLLYTSPSPRDATLSRMPSSA